MKATGSQMHEVCVKHVKKKLRNVECYLLKALRPGKSIIWLKMSNKDSRLPYSQLENDLKGRNEVHWMACAYLAHKHVTHPRNMQCYLLQKLFTSCTQCFNIGKLMIY